MDCNIPALRTFRDGNISYLLQRIVYKMDSFEIF